MLDDLVNWPRYLPGGKEAGARPCGFAGKSSRRAYELGCWHPRRYARSGLLARGRAEVDVAPRAYYPAGKEVACAVGALRAPRLCRGARLIEKEREGAGNEPVNAQT